MVSVGNSAARTYSSMSRLTQRNSSLKSTSFAISPVDADMTRSPWMCRWSFLIWSPMPRASSARKALGQVAKANPEARSAGDDSSTTLRTPFLHSSSDPCLVKPTCHMYTTQMKKLASVHDEFREHGSRLCLCGDVTGVPAYLWSPRATPTPARPAPTMTTSSAASCFCCSMCAYTGLSFDD